jgi:hypothetical protein
MRSLWSMLVWLLHVIALFVFMPTSMAEIHGDLTSDLQKPGVLRRLLPAILRERDDFNIKLALFISS